MQRMTRRMLVVAAIIGLCFIMGVGGLACCTSCGGWSVISISPSSAVQQSSNASSSVWEINYLSSGTVTVTVNHSCVGSGCIPLYEWTVSRTATTPACCDISQEPKVGVISTWSSNGYSPTNQSATFSPKCAGTFTIVFKGLCLFAPPCADYTVTIIVDHILGTCS